MNIWIFCARLIMVLQNSELICPQQGPPSLLRSTYLLILDRLQHLHKKEMSGVGFHLDDQELIGLNYANESRPTGLAEKKTLQKEPESHQSRQSRSTILHEPRSFILNKKKLNQLSIPILLKSLPYAPVNLCFQGRNSSRHCLYQPEPTEKCMD